MDVLLDTHAFIWFVEGDLQLSNHAKSLIENAHAKKYISVISFFEIAVKIKIGKLPAYRDLRECFTDAQKEGFFILPISQQHLTVYDQVPFVQDHRDPFDRLIIATAIAESLTIITADKKFDLYKNQINIGW
jgi:PIN domain nuclease of toxin-antitoxin system